MTHSPVGVIFPAGSQASRQQFDQGSLAAINLESLPVHPTQLYESLFSLAIAAICGLYVERHKRFHGQLFLIWLAAYPIARSIIEMFRGDKERGILFVLSTSQWISILVAAATVGLYIYLRKKRVQPTDA